MNHLKSLEIAWNHSKNHFNCLRYNIFVFKNFFKNSWEYIRMENSNYKNENSETKYLNNMRKDQFLKVKNSLLKLVKDFIEFKDRKLKDRSKNKKRNRRAIF